MEIDFDPIKSDKNLRERGLSFERAGDFDFSTAIVHEDIRKAYPEHRFVAIGLLEGRLHVLCFTAIVRGIRVISFRKANHREEKFYEQASAADR